MEVAPARPATAAVATDLLQTSTTIVVDLLAAVTARVATTAVARRHRATTTTTHAMIATAHHADVHRLMTTHHHVVPTQTIGTDHRQLEAATSRTHTSTEDTEDANHTDVHPAHGAIDEQEGMAERITRHHAVAIGDYIILLEATRADTTTPETPTIRNHTVTATTTTTAIDIADRCVS